MKNKKVSIVIRTFNEEKWISPCLKSVFNQSYDNLEVIIVDNRSTDKTLDEVSLFEAKVVHIDDFYPGRAINLGVKNSSGEIIVCLSGHCIPKSYNWLHNLINGLDNRYVSVSYSFPPLGP